MIGDKGPSKVYDGTRCLEGMYNRQGMTYTVT